MPFSTRWDSKELLWLCWGWAGGSWKGETDITKSMYLTHKTVLHYLVLILDADRSFRLSRAITSKGHYSIWFLRYLPRVSTRYLQMLWFPGFWLWCTFSFWRWSSWDFSFPPLLVLVFPSHMASLLRTQPSLVSLQPLFTLQVSTHFPDEAESLASHSLAFCSLCLSPMG